MICISAYTVTIRFHCIALLKLLCFVCRKITHCCSPSRPQTNIDLKKLEAKRKELKLLIKFYKKRIRWLSTESRQQWGLLLGSRVVLVAEDSQGLSEAGEGETMKEYKAALMKLTEEQLVSKSMVHLVKYGDSASPRHPQGLPFTKFKPE